MNTVSKKPETNSSQNFALKGDYIELYKLLKFESLASSGGEAKQFIATGAVQVNGEVELRKRRKLVVGDKVKFMQASITVTEKPE